MRAVTLAEAKERLGERLDEAIAGEEVTIAREGSPAVRLVAVAQRQPKPRPPIDIDRLLRFSKTMPYQEQSAVDLVRWMRDEHGY